MPADGKSGKGANKTISLLVERDRLIKVLYRKARVMCLADFIRIVEASTKAGQIKAACYLNGNGFVYYDFRSYFE